MRRSRLLLSWFRVDKLRGIVPALLTNEHRDARVRSQVAHSHSLARSKTHTTVKLARNGDCSVVAFGNVAVRDFRPSEATSSDYTFNDLAVD